MRVSMASAAWVATCGRRRRVTISRPRGVTPGPTLVVLQASSLQNTTSRPVRHVTAWPHNASDRAVELIASPQDRGEERLEPMRVRGGGQPSMGVNRVSQPLRQART